MTTKKTFLLYRGDGEIVREMHGTLPEVVNGLAEVLPRHTPVYFDGDLDLAFAEMYAAGAEEGELARAANPLRAIGQRQPFDLPGKEWSGPDEEMPAAALRACGMPRVTTTEIGQMSEEDAYRRLRFYFVDSLPSTYPPGYSEGSFGSWGKLTGNLLGDNYKTAKAAGEGKPPSPKQVEARGRQALEREKKRSAKLAEENKKRIAKGLSPKELSPPAPPKPKKPVKRYGPTGALEVAPAASSKGLQLLPHVAVQGHAYAKGPYRKPGEGEARGGWQKERSKVLSAFGVANGGVCVGSTPSCRASCLVTTGQNDAVVWNRVIKGIRTEALLREPVAFLKALYVAIEKHREACAAAGQLCFVRLNIYSDIPWELVHPELFATFADVQFYDYTKVAGRDVGAIPNYHLTFSYGGTEISRQRMWREYHRRGRQVAIVFNVPKNRSFEGLTIDGQKVLDGDLHDIRTWEPSPSVIGLRYKLPRELVPEEMRTGPTDREIGLAEAAAEELPRYEGRDLLPHEAHRKAEILEAVSKLAAYAKLSREEKRDRTKANKERQEGRREVIAGDYFLVQVEKDPSTGLFIMATVPRLIGAGDFEELPRPGGEVDALHAEAVPEAETPKGRKGPRLLRSVPPLSLAGNDGDDTLS